MAARALVTTYSFDAGSDSRSVTLPSDCQVVEISIDTIASGVDQSSVSTGGQACDRNGLGTIAHSGGKPRVSVWKRISPATGSQTIAITNASGDKTGVAIYSWTSINLVTPFDGWAPAQGTSNAPSVNVASAAGDRVADTVAHLSTMALTQGAGQSELVDFMPVDGRMGGSHEAGAASVTMSWSIGESKEWALGAFNANDAAAAAASLPRARRDRELSVLVQL